MFNAEPSLKPSQRQFWQAFIMVSVAISAVALYKAEQQALLIPSLRLRLKWFALMGLFALNLVLGIYLLWRRDQSEHLWQRLEFSANGTLSKILGLALVLGSLPILWYIRFDIFQKPPIMFSILLWAWLWITLMQAAGLKLLTRNPWPLSFGLALLLGGIIFQFYFLLQPVTDYPFSLGWSEASRFYYGSLPFSESLYGARFPLSAWHGSRYFLLSLAFLFGRTSLWAARLWQAFLWIAICGLNAFVMVRRLKWNSLVVKVLIGGWFMQFLFQGAVYYHLLICVIIVLAGVSPRHVLRSLLAVAAASFWAGMSRVNWFPVPAMLAVTLYLLEEPFSKKNNFWKYIQTPMLWGVTGLALAFAGQFFYIAISGNEDLSAFGSSFTSALLFYRWWPSDTNALGVIPGLIIISFPPLAVLAWILRGRWRSIHPLRWLGLSAMFVILLGGGLVVSTKIGGGGDLHNMDAFIVLLGMVTLYFLSERVEFESAPFPALKMDGSFVLASLLLIPVAFSLSRVIPPVVYDHKQAADDLQTLRTTVQSYSKEGEVLFIYERHLLTFDMIPGVPLVPEYEVITLTEMAISNNQPYLDGFYHDLQTHRFSAIVARKQSTKITDTGDFAEESNAWNSLVAYHLLCEYEPVLSLESSNIQVFVPRAEPKCP